MQSLGEKKEYNRVVQGTCIKSNAAYLILHLIYLILFIIGLIITQNNKYWILIILGGVSLLIYLLTFIVIKKGLFKLYAYICGFEFISFNSAATIICGLYPGFHLSIIGLSIVSFFTTYFSKVKRDIKQAVAWTVYSLVIYLVLYYVTLKMGGSIINLEEWLYVTLNSINSCLVFAFIIFYLVIFTKYAMKLEEKILNESRTDKLSGLHNRYDLYNYLDSINDKTDYALAIFDIDNFKKVNDTYGHIYGDYVIKEISKIAKNYSCDQFVARYGGEEFIVIIKLDNDINKSFTIMEDIRSKIDEFTFDFNGIKSHITVSIGISKYQEGIGNDDWIKNADEKLYEAKYNGKNQTIM